MLNPYQLNYGFYPNQNQNVLPQQQIIQVNGKASVDTMQLAPNSSLLALDSTAPIVWMCISDGIGKVTATPYDIFVHKDEPKPDISNIEKRILAIENTLAEMEKKYDKPYDSKSKQRQNYAGGSNVQNNAKPADNDSKYA